MQTMTVAGDQTVPKYTVSDTACGNVTSVCIHGCCCSNSIFRWPQ